MSSIPYRQSSSSYSEGRDSSGLKIIIEDIGEDKSRSSLVSNLFNMENLPVPPINSSPKLNYNSLSSLPSNPSSSKNSSIIQLSPAVQQAMKLSSYTPTNSSSTSTNYSTPFISPTNSPLSSPRKIFNDLNNNTYKQDNSSHNEDLFGLPISILCLEGNKSKVISRVTDNNLNKNINFLILLKDSVHHKLNYKYYNNPSSSSSNTSSSTNTSNIQDDTNHIDDCYILKNKNNNKIILFEIFFNIENLLLNDEKLLKKMDELKLSIKKLNDNKHYLIYNERNDDDNNNKTNTNSSIILPSNLPNPTIKLFNKFLLLFYYYFNKFLSLKHFLYNNKNFINFIKEYKKDFSSNKYHPFIILSYFYTLLNFNQNDFLILLYSFFYSNFLHYLCLGSTYQCSLKNYSKLQLNNKKLRENFLFLLNGYNKKDEKEFTFDMFYDEKLNNYNIINDENNDNDFEKDEKIDEKVMKNRHKEIFKYYFNYFQNIDTKYMNVSKKLPEYYLDNDEIRLLLWDYDKKLRKEREREERMKLEEENQKLSPFSPNPSSNTSTFSSNFSPSYHDDDAKALLESAGFSSSSVTPISSPLLRTSSSRFLKKEMPSFKKILSDKEKAKSSFNLLSSSLNSPLAPTPAPPSKTSHTQLSNTNPKTISNSTVSTSLNSQPSLHPDIDTPSIHSSSLNNKPFSSPLPNNSTTSQPDSDSPERRDSKTLGSKRISRVLNSRRNSKSNEPEIHIENSEKIVEEKKVLDPSKLKETPKVTGRKLLKDLYGKPKQTEDIHTNVEKDVNNSNSLPPPPSVSISRDSSPKPSSLKSSIKDKKKKESIIKKEKKTVINKEKVNKNSFDQELIEHNRNNYEDIDNEEEERKKEKLEKDPEYRRSKMSFFSTTTPDSYSCYSSPIRNKSPLKFVINEALSSSVCNLTSTLSSTTPLKSSSPLRSTNLQSSTFNNTSCITTNPDDKYSSLVFSSHVLEASFSPKVTTRNSVPPPPPPTTPIRSYAPSASSASQVSSTLPVTSSLDKVINFLESVAPLESYAQKSLSSSPGRSSPTTSTLPVASFPSQYPSNDPTEAYLFSSLFTSSNSSSRILSPHKSASPTRSISPSRYNHSLNIPTPPNHIYSPSDKLKYREMIWKKVSKSLNSLDPFPANSAISFSSSTSSSSPNSTSYHKSLESIRYEAYTQGISFLKLPASDHTYKKSKKNSNKIKITEKYNENNSKNYINFSNSSPSHSSSNSFSSSYSTCSNHLNSFSSPISSSSINYSYEKNEDNRRESTCSYSLVPPELKYENVEDLLRSNLK